jgi:ketosteroid isomerase-like protein
MPEESTTPDLEELNRAFIEAANRGDVDAFMSFFAPDAVWDNSPVGTGTFEGAAAVRGVVEDWMSIHEEFEVKTEEFRDLGNGVGFGVNVQRGRPVGSTGVVRLRQGFVSLVEGGLIERVTTYLDPNEARAAAERLAQERRQAVSGRTWRPSARPTRRSTRATSK